MAIATETGTVGAPVVKFTEIGDTLIGACGSDPRYSKRQRQDYESGKLLYKGADGKPTTEVTDKVSMEEILHLVVMPDTTAKSGTAEDGYERLEPGTHVRHPLSGWKWKQVIDARRELPAVGDDFRHGQTASSDVYEITLVAFSAETKNPENARKAGFTVENGRIVVRSEGEHERYVLAQSKNGGNTNMRKEYSVVVRRIGPDEGEWEAQADELFLTKPWEYKPDEATNGNGSSGNGAVSDDITDDDLDVLDPF